MDKFIDWQPCAREELRQWKQDDPKIAKRIFELLKSIQETPFKGLGKPEPLKYDLQGYWSRCIDKINRLVYLVTDDAIIIFSCKHHYEK